MRNCRTINKCSSDEIINISEQNRENSNTIPHNCNESGQTSNYEGAAVDLKKEADVLSLVDKAQQGDEEAMEYLLSKYSRYIFQAEKKFFLPGGTREDLLQEGFIGLFMAVRTYDIRRSLSFEDYASLSIRNSILRAVRSATQKKRLLLTGARSIDDDFSTFKEIADNRNPEDIVLGKFEAEILYRFIDSMLSGSERTVLKLKAASYSVDEIVIIADEDKKRVENALYRGRRKIKAHILNNKIKSYFNREKEAKCG